MNKIIEKPHFLFLPFCLIAFLISKFWFGGFTINIKDTYYVMSHHDLTTLISLLFGIIGLIYWIVKKTNGNLSKRLNLIHVVLTFGGIFLILVLNEFFRKSIMEYDFNENLTMVIYLISAIVIFGQIIFPINIINGILKKRKKTSG
jgi:heme/copper-type cytochrome/quinol oxidase subunit 1